MVYVSNAFSLGMVLAPFIVEGTEVRAEDAADALRNGAKSVVGHANTAAILEGLLGVPVPTDRTSIKLIPGDTLFVAQYNGPRLAEGATALPEGAGFTFLKVIVR